MPSTEAIALYSHALIEDFAQSSFTLFGKRACEIQCLPALLLVNTCASRCVFSADEISIRSVVISSEKRPVNHVSQSLCCTGQVSLAMAPRTGVAQLFLCFLIISVWTVSPSPIELCFVKCNPGTSFSVCAAPEWQYAACSSELNLKTASSNCQNCHACGPWGQSLSITWTLADTDTPDWLHANEGPRKCTLVCKLHTAILLLSLVSGNALLHVSTPSETTSSSKLACF
eukprot:1798253-Pleurochrysis_carterae.AAC.2